MTLTPNLSLGFDGQCEAAFKFYEQHLGGTMVRLFRYAGSPMENDVPPDWGGKVMHATMVLGEAVIAGADVTLYRRPQGFSILLNVDEIDDAERLYRVFTERGTVTVPMQQTFWSVRYAAVVDQFGVPWEINCQQAPETGG